MDAVEQLRSALTERYVIDREIGAGGMARVYLARDLKHDRQVALKVLRPELSSVLGDGRFLTEIKVTAHLQHPNLLPLFDSGEVEGLLYYVMPYVEGETLRQRLAREKQLPVDVALRMAVAIASALDYAHRQGVIHRDLKPENILLHEDQPLVADFGIALAVSKAGGSRITQTGLSLGTPQYMSPEQAAGDRAIDGRTDLYSLAAVLYEMLTGDPPYIGSTAQAIIAKVLTERPRSVRASRPSVPAHVAAAVERALEKLPADRFSTARELADALQERPNTVEVHAPATATPRSAHSVLPFNVALATTAIVASGLAAWAWLRTAPPPSGRTSKFQITFPDNVKLSNLYAPVALSPDGMTLVLRVETGAGASLARRPIDALDVTVVKGTEGGGVPVVSPDGKWLAFQPGPQLYKVRFDGGAPIPIASTDGHVRGVAWARNDMLVVGASETGFRGLATVPASGGTPKPLTRLDTTRESAHSWPRVLDDGNTIVYVTWSKLGPPSSRLAVTTLSSGGADSQILDLDGTVPLGVVEGHLLYVRLDGVLMAAPFDVRARKTIGSPIAVMAGVLMIPEVASARIALSSSGTLAYVGDSTQLIAANFAGVAQPLTKEVKKFGTPAWSPRSEQIALSVVDPRGVDVWVCDAASGALRRFTTDGSSTAPSWTRDGKHIVYVSSQGGRSAVWWRAADESTPATKLFEPPDGAIGEAVLSPDNHTLVYRVQAENEVYVVDLSGNRAPTPVDPGRLKAQPTLSPDGKWLAYTSDDGSGPQIVVMPFPGKGGATQLSNVRGTDPVWSPDGRQLYFFNGRRVQAVDFTPGPVPTASAPRTLFQGPFVSAGTAGRLNMSVSPDGKRFVMLRRLEPLIVVTNWVDQIRAQLAAKSR